MDKYELDPEKDVLFRGEFEVVKELMAALPDGAVISTLLTLENMQRKPTYFPLLFPFNFHFSTMTIAFIFKKRPEKFPWGKSGRALALHCFSKVSNIVVKECLF